MMTTLTVQANPHFSSKMDGEEFIMNIVAELEARGFTLVSSVNEITAKNGEIKDALIWKKDEVELYTNVQAVSENLYTAHASMIKCYPSGNIGIAKGHCGNWKGDNFVLHHNVSISAKTSFYPLGNITLLGDDLGERDCFMGDEKYDGAWKCLVDHLKSCASPDVAARFFPPADSAAFDKTGPQSSL